METALTFSVPGPDDPPLPGPTVPKTPTNDGFQVPEGYRLVPVGYALVKEGQPAAAAQPLPRQTSSLAITAFISTFLFWPLALVFGPMALAEIHKDPRLNGSGMAGWSTFISYLTLMAIAGYLFAFGLRLPFSLGL